MKFLFFQCVHRCVTHKAFQYEYSTKTFSVTVQRNMKWLQNSEHIAWNLKYKKRLIRCSDIVCKQIKDSIRPFGNGDYSLLVGVTVGWYCLSRLIVDISWAWVKSDHNMRKLEFKVARLRNFLVAHSISYVASFKTKKSERNSQCAVTKKIFKPFWPWKSDGICLTGSWCAVGALLYRRRQYLQLLNPVTFKIGGNELN